MKNSSLLRRLKYYGIGFGLGLIFVVFFFQNRGCSWLPDNRVKNAVLQRVIVIPENQEKLFETSGITRDVLVQYLNEGVVEFGDSDKKGPNKRYKISLDERPNIYFTLPQESFVSAAYIEPPKKVDERSGLARPVYFPNEKDFVFIDTNQVLNCELKQFGWSESLDVYNDLKSIARLNFDESQFEAVRKPRHVFTMSVNRKKVNLECIWYKNKINVVALSSPQITPCE